MIPKEFESNFGPVTDQHRKVYKFMLQEAPECREQGEINTTMLAETTSSEYDLYEDHVDYPIPEWVFELAMHAEEHING